MNKNKRADGILLDYVLESNTKGYWITSKPNPILNGVDIMVRKHNLTYQQSIPFDILNKVNIAKEDLIRTIIEELVCKIDERRNDDGDAVGEPEGRFD